MSRTGLPIVLSLLGATALMGGSRLAVAAPAPNPNPFILIGVDGMESSVVEDLQGRGQMPNLKALRSRGVSSPLKTDYGANSPVVWTTVATGRDKEDHGIVNFDVATDNGTAPVSSTMRKVPAIWNILSRPEFGRKVMMLGWWGSWPAEEVSGVIVSDRANHKIDDRVSPKSFSATFDGELKAINGDRSLFPNNDDAGAEDRIMSYYLQKNATGPYNLLMAYIHGTDLVSHKYWKYYRSEGFTDVDPAQKAKYADKIPEKYRAVDTMLGRVVAAAPKNANIVIISDHGFGPLPDQFVKVSLDLDALLAHFGVLTRSGRTVDLGRTKVYNYETAAFQMVKMVRFARAGREKGGTVTPAEEAAIRADLTAKLAAVRYETGKPVFKVRDAKPFEAKKGADFMVEVIGEGPTDALVFGKERYTDVVAQIVEHSGGHGWEPPGVFYAAGPDIDPKGKVEGIRIHDITPTLLYGMGLPIAEDFDGKVIEGLFPAAFRSAHPVTKVPSYGTVTAGKPTENAETDEEMLERLRSLGYIQ